MQDIPFTIVEDNNISCVNVDMTEAPHASTEREDKQVCVTVFVNSIDTIIMRGPAVDMAAF